MQLQKLPFRGYFYTAIALSLVSVILIVIAKPNLPPIVPLFYGRPTGNSQLTPTLGLLLIPAFTLGISLINVVASIRLTDKFMKKILAVASLFISILGLITLIKIVLLVGFW